MCAFDAVTLEFLWRAGTGVRTIAVCGNELYAANNASRQHIYRQHRGRVEVFSFKGQCPYLSHSAPRRRNALCTRCAN